MADECFGQAQFQPKRQRLNKYVSRPTKNSNPKLNIVIDRSEIEKDKDAKIEQLTRENQKHEETIKNMLISEKQKFESSTNYMGVKEPIPDPNSPPLTEPKKQLWNLKNVDLMDSAILGMNPKFPSTEEAMNYIKKIAENPQAEDYELANSLYGKLVNKALKQGGVFEYQGNLCRYERHGNQIVKSNRPKTFKKVD